MPSRRLERSQEVRATSRVTELMNFPKHSRWEGMRMDEEGHNWSEDVCIAPNGFILITHSASIIMFSSLYSLSFVFVLSLTSFCVFSSVALIFLLPPIGPERATTKGNVLWTFAEQNQSRQILTSRWLHIPTLKPSYEWHYSQVHDISMARQPAPGCMLRHLTKSEDDETLNEGKGRRWRLFTVLLSRRQLVLLREMWKEEREIQREGGREIKDENRRETKTQRSF